MEHIAKSSILRVPAVDFVLAGFVGYFVGVGDAGACITP